MSNNILTLFSSDSTVQYTKDVFSVLSLPRGSIFQFRYQSQYVDDAVKTIFENEKKGTGYRVLIAFRSNANTAEDGMFILPIRWAVITSVKLFSDVYSVYFKLTGYPTFTHAFKNRVSDYSKINDYAKNYFQSHNKDIAVHSVPLDAVEIRNNDDVERDTENWRSIVEAFTKIPSYSECYFLKCSSLYTEIFNSKNEQKTIVNCPIIDGHFVLTEGQCTNLNIEYYSSIYDRTRIQKIEVLVDENVVRKVRGMRTLFQSRYGCITLGFQSQSNSNNTISEISIHTEGMPANVIQTDAVFPIITQKNKLYKIKKSIIMGLGAALVALPGIIGNNINVVWNIVLAILGVLILGINNYWESKE